MKVLLVADAVGGVFTHVVELSRALVAAGERVVLATEGAELTADRRRAVEALEGVVHEGRGRAERVDGPGAPVPRAEGDPAAPRRPERPRRDLESLREVWDGAAELVPPWDDDALADAIARLARDEPRRRVLGARGRARALAFTPARMAAGYRALYAALAAGALP